MPDSKGAGGQEPAAAKAEWVKRNQKVALQKEHLGRSSEEKLLFFWILSKFLVPFHKCIFGQ